MPTETIIKEARDRVSDLYGTDLAKKASDKFCLVFGSSAAENLTFAESVPVVRTQAAVLEFSRESTRREQVDREVENVRGHELWSRLQNDVGRLSEMWEGLAFQASQFLRNAKLHALRDDFYRSAGPIFNAVERGARGFFEPGPEAQASPQTPSSVTEICWLNRTVRAFVDPRLIAEIASDKSIEQIDLPRRLEAEITTSTKTVGAPQYRDRFNVTGKGIVVGVIDSEVALQHPALTDRVLHKQNYTKELWGHPGAHGTAVAGIIGANDPVFQGVAPDVTIYNYKVLASNRFLNADDFGGTLAIQQALEDGAHIVNCSWGAGAAGDGTSREARACDEAWALGMTIVKSAGNRGPGSQTLTTPADADGVIVVGATDQLGQAIQDYSSRGFTPGGKQRPHLVAPGGVAAEGITSCQVGGGFGDCGHGTSYAAPHITGLLALILQGQPELSPDEQRDILLDCCNAFNPKRSSHARKGSTFTAEAGHSVMSGSRSCGVSRLSTSSSSEILSILSTGTRAFKVLLIHALPVTTPPTRRIASSTGVDIRSNTSFRSAISSVLDGEGLRFFGTGNDRGFSPTTTSRKSFFEGNELALWARS